jgi:hypothetical protein
VRSHRRESVSPNRTRGLGRAARGGASSLLFALVCLLAGAFQVAPAAAACPNEVFRTGPSAKLPDCRAYELVTPAYTGGIIPEGKNWSDMPSAFNFPLLTDTGDSVMFTTNEGALSGTAGTGWVDRYRAKRTADGWKTEFIGPTAEQARRALPAGTSADHQYYFLNAGHNNITLEPESTLQKPFGGEAADYLRKPNGEFELIGVGSLGSSQNATGLLITPGAGHVIFSTETQLEPEAPPTGKLAVYDRTPGGPTHVISLLPGDVTPTAGVTQFLSASEDGSEVAFAQGEEPSPGAAPANVRYFVRRNNSETEEVVRFNGVVVGKKLTCEGGGGDSVAYAWLREGAAIPGATEASYTTTPADAGSAVQCQVTAANSDAAGIQASLPAVVEPYEGKNPPILDATIVGGLAEYTLPVVETGNPGFAEVGESVTCTPGSWEENPTYAYHWYRNGAEIAGATGATYTLAGADEGEATQCRVTASNADGSAVAFSAAVPVHPAPVFAATMPAISNLTDAGDAPEAGDELSCSDGTWTGAATFGYQWLRDGTAIAGATSSTHTVVAADESKTLQCVVTATNAAGSVGATSLPVVVDPQPGTAPPQPDESFGSPGFIFGGSEVGSFLFCSAGEWTGEPTAFGFRWLRDGAPIVGEAGESYITTQADIGSMIQCEVTATNAAGSTAATYAGALFGPLYVTPSVPSAQAALPMKGPAYGGIFGGKVFYSDNGIDGFGRFQLPGNLYSYDTASGSTTTIVNTGDALFSHVSQNGDFVYFVSPSAIGGEGVDGEPNLYVWSRADHSTTFIATVEPADLVGHSAENELAEGRGANLTTWTYAMERRTVYSTVGHGSSNTRSVQGGSVLLFQTTAQLTSFDNLEAAPESCGLPSVSGDRCIETYRYDATSKQLTCVSCPSGDLGPATGESSLFRYKPITDVNPPSNLSLDGHTVVFESTEDLIPQDGNERRDVYRWKKDQGLALISTGQDLSDSYLFAVTPNASDIAFITRQQLLPEDQNGGTPRIYDARVNGGFAPPESAVTEPCSGDACQGNPGPAAQLPSIASSSLNGQGNVRKKLKCPKGRHRVTRHGKERCVKRRHRHRKHHRHANSKPGAKR